MSETSIIISDNLSGMPDTVEILFTLLRGSSICGSIALDLAPVTWVHPYGAISLLGICRYIRQLTRKPVRLTGLQTQIHAYLRRIDFFKYDPETVYTTDPFNPLCELGRSSSSSNVLELFPIRTSEDVYAVAARARRILAYWFDKNSSYNIDKIVVLLAEACSNIVDHSGDSGIVIVQKYDHKQYVEIKLAISDLGQGIRRSLIAVHGEISNTSTGYIEQALSGLSARTGQRGGQGLGAIQRIATENGGSLYIRSEMGSVLAQATGMIAQDNLCFFPGTQIAITFRSLPAF
ncbi:MAG TPA: ATP-binding protein [Ktedonobacteraceae bacterium]|nr:ATP-binding protein [Ktedonobacteraceae bacterium]